MDDPKMTDNIAAFVDGELDSAAMGRLLEQMAGDPAMTQQALAAYQMKQAIRRSLQSETLETPAKLRSEIATSLGGMTERGDQPQPAANALTMQAATGSWWARGPALRRWVPAMAAAVLLLAAVVARIAPGTGGEPGTKTGGDLLHTVQQPQDPGILPASQVDRFVARHVRCQSQIDKLRESVQFPTEVAMLSGSIETFVGSRPGIALDLTELGYTFWKAGECRIPSSPAVHLIYRAMPQSDRHDSLSLWMERDQGQLANLEEGKTYRASPDNAVHPTFVWRDGGMIYYLVGDALDAAEPTAMQLATRD
jgi:hypothetical protein